MKGGLSTNTWLSYIFYNFILKIRISQSDRIQIFLKNLNQTDCPWMFNPKYTIIKFWSLKVINSEVQIY